MADRQAPTGQRTAEQEDRDLFKTYGGPISVDLVPQVFRTGKGEVLIRGFFNSSVHIDVVFAGRRAAEVGPLIAQLKAVDTQARLAAASAKRPEPQIDHIRLPVQVKGSWRHSFVKDVEGQDTRSYQLIAARWAFADASGQLAQYGEAPLCAPQTGERRKSYILSTREFDAVPQSFRDS